MQVSIAGVPWPVHKAGAVLANLLILLIVGVVTMNPAAAVLSGAAVGAVIYVAGEILERIRQR